MIQLFLIILLIWLIYDKFRKDKIKTEIDITNSKENLKTKTNNSSLKEINKMIDELKINISKAAKKENIKDLCFYTEMLEVLIEERSQLLKEKFNLNKFKTTIKNGLSWLKEKM